MRSGAPRPGTLVIVVDDDESIRDSLPALLGVLGYATLVFASAEEFLACRSMPDTRCLIVDIAMPDMSGPELQRELIRRGHGIPTVFITALSEQSIPPDLLRDGAVDCLFKPFSERDLREALDAAIVP
jgi:FixJ family two-component response regulator